MNTAFTALGPVQVGRYQTLAIAQALEFYAKTGMKVNRAYTPTNMMRMASKITGRTFKPRAYVEAAQALRAMLEGAQP